MAFTEFPCQSQVVFITNGDADGSRFVINFSVLPSEARVVLPCPEWFLSYVIVIRRAIGYRPEPTRLIQDDFSTFSLTAFWEGFSARVR